MSEAVKHVNIDYIERLMVDNNNPVELPLFHRFTEGLYVREIHMPKGIYVTSRTHKTRHQFMVLKGEVSVMMEDGEWQRIKAPYLGVTEVGTRRFLYIHKNCIWATCHANPDNLNVEDIENLILEPHTNPLLTIEEKREYKELLSNNKKILT